ncbi:MAG: ABC transporter permease [Lachnospiraceae bacterium]
MKRKKFDWSKYGIFFAWIILVAGFTVCESSFLTINNILNILRQVSIVGISAVGMTFIILSGGMDLSIGSVIGVSAVLAALLSSSGLHPVLAALVSLMTGAVIGAFNGVLINEVGIAPMISGLGLMTALRGVAYIIANGQPVYGIPDSFKILGQGYFLGIPIPVIIMGIIFFGGWVVANKTVFGRCVYGIGGNTEATRLSGIRVKRIKYQIYILNGVLSALAGVILMSRTNSGQPKAGDGYEMDVITACVLGGISTSGGEGNFLSVIVGVVMMGTLTNGMVLMNVQEFYQWVVKGAVLILAVAIDVLAKRTRKSVRAA